MNRKTNRWLAVIFLCAFLFFSGVILVFAFFLPRGEENQVEPTLSAMLTANAVNDAVATRVAQEVGSTQFPSAATLISPEIFLTPEPTLPNDDGSDSFVYHSMPGDTITAVAARFDVSLDDLLVSGSFAPTVFLPMGTRIQIPVVSFERAPADWLLPDAAVVYGFQDVGFDVRAFVAEAGGFLNTYQGDARGVWMDGPAIVERVALEHSISAKLLLAVLEYRSGWVYGDTEGMHQDQYPLGFHADKAEGLYEELYIAARLLGYGYYGWRDGSRNQVIFADQHTLRLDPSINAGTAAIENLFASLEKRLVWEQQLFSEDSLVQTYAAMFGDPWAGNAVQIPDWLPQPALALPFQHGDPYHLTSGPHRAWGLGSPWAAVDFAPADQLRGCLVSPFWLTASAPGLVIRSENGVVVIDLDGDGWEQTGWVLFYLHVADEERVTSGTWVETGTAIGHASCEGGAATGSHVHLARKYNGEWMPAAGAIPMNLSGWVVMGGEREYQGSLVRDGRTITAYPSANLLSLVSLDE